MKHLANTEAIRPINTKPENYKITSTTPKTISIVIKENIKKAHGLDTWFTGEDPEKP